MFGFGLFFLITCVIRMEDMFVIQGVLEMFQFATLHEIDFHPKFSSILASKPQSLVHVADAVI